MYNKSEMEQKKNNNPSTGTMAPKYIPDAEMHKMDKRKDIKEKRQG